MVIKVDGNLVLIADRFFDARIKRVTGAPGGMYIRYQVGWMDWRNLTHGSDFWVFADTAEGTEQCLTRAIAEGIERLDAYKVTVDGD